MAEGDERYEFTEEELAEMKEELGTLEVQLRELVGKRKMTTDRMKLGEKKVTDRMDELAMKIRDGYEVRNAQPEMFDN